MMKPEKLFSELKSLAEKLGIHVLEQNFRNAGIHVKSGYCIVKGKDHCIIDKHIKLQKKIDVLSECLALFPHDTIYLVPAAREHLDLYAPPKKVAEESDPEPIG
jgi:hypothetical protein